MQAPAEPGVKNRCNKKGRGGRARRLLGGGAGALGWGRRAAGHLSLPLKCRRSRGGGPKPPPPPRSRGPLGGIHPTCGWGDGSASSRPPPPFLPLPAASPAPPRRGYRPVRGGGSGAWGLWVAVKAACDRCPPLTALGISPVAPCHWLSAADRQGCSL